MVSSSFRQEEWREKARGATRLRRTPFLENPDLQLAFRKIELYDHLCARNRPAWLDWQGYRVQMPDKIRHASDVRSESIARRLGFLTSLSPEETDLLRRVGGGPASIWAPKSLVEQPAGDHPSPRYLISGWAARVRELSDGRRQLVQLVLPGDALAPHLHIRHQLQTVQCLNMVQTVDGGAIRLAARDPARFPGIAAAVELAAAHDRALLMDQVARLGRQTAFERMASMLLELRYRFQPVGLVLGDSFAFPLTQESIGDLLGLSLVHVNRTLQLMRHQKMISLKQGRLTLLDVPALMDAGEFKPPSLEHVP
jgi:CRP-like cAMP-binding protein